MEYKPRRLRGIVYMRSNAEQPQSKVAGGKCSEPEAACTIAVSGTVSPEAAQFWGAADDGSKAIFAVVAGPLKGNLYEFDVATRKARLIAGGVEGPMGMSEDAGRIYFDSTKALAGGAKAGAHNLYLYQTPAEEGEEGGFRFIMGLAGRDPHRSEGTPHAV